MIRSSQRSLDLTDPLDSTPSPSSAHLLDHLRVLPHDVEEAVVRRHGSGPFLGGARQLLEQVGDDVVQAGAASRTHHRIWTHTHKHVSDT